MWLLMKVVSWPNEKQEWGETVAGDSSDASLSQCGDRWGVGCIFRPMKNE